jgi:hypothetical protein
MQAMGVLQVGGSHLRAQFEWNALRTATTKMVDDVNVSTLNDNVIEKLPHLTHFDFIRLQVTLSG